MGVELETGKTQERGWVRGAIIGAGASGTVSLAMSSSNGELFAVKSAAGFSVALDNEYQILRLLDSPYIVRSLGCGYSVENGAEVHNLFMEFMPGGSVADLLIKFGGRLEGSVIRAYTRGILHGIDYLHRQGIVHCDITALEMNLLSAPFTTHSFAQGQRMLRLKLAAAVRVGTNTYSVAVTAPPNGNIAPSSYYTLFPLTQGIPGIAAWIQITNTRQTMSARSEVWIVSARMI